MTSAKQKKEIADAKQCFLKQYGSVLFGMGDDTLGKCNKYRDLTPDWKKSKGCPAKYGHHLEWNVFHYILHPLLKDTAYRVAWGVEWFDQSASVQDQTNGEIDFVIVFPDRAKALLIEATTENISVMEKNGNLRKKSSRKDMTQRMNDSMNFIKKVCHGKYGKSISLERIFYTPNWNPKCKSDHQDCAFDDKHLVRLIKHKLSQDNSAGDALDLDLAIELFKTLSEVKCVEDIHGHQPQIWLTNETSPALEAFGEGQSWVIRGVAGSGKSNIALYACNKQADNECNVLLLCKPINLAVKYRKKLSDTHRDKYVKVRTWDEFRQGFLRAAGHKPSDLNDNIGKADDWQKIHRMTGNGQIPQEWQFDHIVVDEGQMFNAMECDIIFHLCKSNTPAVLVVASYRQRAFDDNEEKIEGYLKHRNVPEVNLDESHRITHKMALMIEHLLGETVRASKRFHHKDPEIDVLGYSDNDCQLARINDIVNIPKTSVIKRVDARRKHKKDLGLPCVALSMKSVKKAFFGNIYYIGIEEKGFPLVKPIETRAEGNVIVYWDKDRNKHVLYNDKSPPKGNFLHCDTVLRYPGMQARTVILTDVDDDLDMDSFGPSKAKNVHAKLLLGMTRALERLIILAQEDSAIYTKLLKAADKANARKHGES